jgi:very-short-patch-repair endonuclease
VFSWEQAQGFGVSKSMLHRRVASGLWIPVYPTVYAPAGVPLTLEGRLMAACLWAGPEAAVSHRASGTLWGLDHCNWDVVEISSPRRTPAPKGIIYHRRIMWPEKRVTMIRGIPVLDVARTLYDLCAVTTKRRVEAAMDYAIRRRMTSLELLDEILEEEARQGRNGTRRFRELLTDRSSKITDSDLQRDLYELLIEGGFEGFKTHFAVRDELGFYREVDIAFPDVLFGIEVVGYAAHSSKPAFDADAPRERRLMAKGWVIIRVTANDLRYPDRLLADIRECLTTRQKLFDAFS